jgi:predicted GNAT family acetyltransferase
MADITVRKNDALHRYELFADGTLAGYSEFNVLSNAILFTHTEVLPEFEGQGYGSALIKAALDDVRSMGAHVIPVCQVVAGYMRRHAEYQDLATPEIRKAFQI